MLPAVQNQGDGPHAGHQIPVSLHLLPGDPGGGGKDIVGVLQQRGLGIGEAHALAAGHGMAADEAFLQPGLPHRLMDGRLHAAHVGEQAPRLHHCLYRLQVPVVSPDRGAEEQVVALGEAGVYGRGDDIGHGRLFGQKERLPIDVVGDDFDVRDRLFQGPGNGAPDQSQSDKAAGQLRHGISSIPDWCNCIFSVPL